MDVIKNKNRVERLRKDRRKDDMAAMKMESAFRARLYSELRKVDILFSKDEVESVIVNVPDKFLAKFSAAIYSEDLAQYDITQVDGKANSFNIKRRFISF